MVPAEMTVEQGTQSETPQLLINRESTVDLDSSHAFEGPEKLLEVWFAPSPGQLPVSVNDNGLKSIPADAWTEMLDIVNCKVLSVVSSDHVDAYLLSESSMFVFSHKLILKTCGTTTLLLGLASMLALAAQAGFPFHVTKGGAMAATPYRVFYSRKNFLFPDRQHVLHKSWRNEVKFLDAMFNGGSAYMVGKMNGDHWYLYLTTPNISLTTPATPICGTRTTTLLHPAENLNTHRQRVDDETLEILMTDLDPDHAHQFYLSHAAALATTHLHARADAARLDAHQHLGELKNHDAGSGLPSMAIDVSVADNLPTVFEELTTEGHALGTLVSETSGLSSLYPTSRYPNAKIDAYLFTPCGFSANGVVPVESMDDTVATAHYFTVHVTPEPHCSYASFETNIPSDIDAGGVATTISRVVDIFRPARFSVTLFEATGGMGPMTPVGKENLGSVSTTNAHHPKRRDQDVDVGIEGYTMVDRIVHGFDGYDLVFRYFERVGWTGGVPWLGEVDV